MENFALSLFPVSLSSLPLRRALRPGQTTQEVLLIRLRAAAPPPALARDVRLTLTPRPGVEILRLQGASPYSFGVDGIKIVLPDIGYAPPGDEGACHAEREIDLLVALEVTTPPAPGVFSLLSLALRCRLEGVREEQILREEVRISLQNEPTEEIDPEVERLAAGAGLLSGAREKKDSGSQERAGGEATHGNASPRAGSERSGEGGDPTHNPSPTGQRALWQGPFPKASLVFINGDRTGDVCPLGAEITVGRGQGNTIILSDRMVAPTHARIRFQEGQFWLLDAGGAFPSRVNGKPVGRYLLKNGDVIDIGLTKMRFEKP